MRATLYKALSNERTPVELPAGKTIREALPGLDLDSAIIVVNGRVEKPGYTLEENDIVMVRLVPGMTGLAITAIVVGVVAVGVAIWGGIQAYNAKVAAEDAQAELDKVKKLTNKSDIDNRPFLRGASNTLATGNSQPYVVGRHLFTPYLLCSPFYRIAGTDGESQYTYTVLECGFNSQIIQKIAIDDITIKTFKDDAPQEGTFAIDRGVFAEDGLIEIAQDGKPFGVLDVLNHKVASTTCNDEIPHDSDVAAGTQEYLTYTLNPYAMDVDVAITFPYGLYAMDDNGDKMETQVTVTPQYSLDGGTTWTGFTFDNNGTRTNTFRRNVSSKELRFVAHKDFSAENYNTLRARGQGAIMLRIRSNGNKDSAIKNDCYCVYYQSTCFDPEKSMGGDAYTSLVPCKVVEDRERAYCTIIALRLKASKLNEDKLKKINVITQGIARTWNGAEWSEGKTATRNPAAWALEIETSPCHPASRRDDEELDLESYGEFYEHCERMGYKFDWVITQGRKKDDVLGHIMETTGACVYTDIYGRRAIAIDRPQENALAVYNPQNIVRISNRKSFGRRTDGLRIKYVSGKDDLYQEATYLVMREVDGVPLELTGDSIIKDLTVTGITEHEHVVKYARRLMAVEALRPKTTTIEVGNEGVFYTPYSKVLIQDDSLKIGIGKGYTIRECVWYGGLLKRIRVNGRLEGLDPAKAHGVIVSCYAGGRAVPVPIKVEGTDGTDELEVLSRVGAGADAVPEAGNVLSLGVLDADGEFSRVTTPYVISGIKRTDKGFSLDLVNYDEAIYDSGTIPDYRGNITPRPTGNARTIPADTVTRFELAEEVAAAMGKIDPSGSDAAQEAANVVTHGVHFTKMHRIRDMQMSLEEVVARLDDDMERTSACISMSEEEILLRVDDMERELVGLVSVQAGAVQALVAGGGAEGQLSLSLELPAMVDAATRGKLVRASDEATVAAVYAKLDGTDLYSIRGDAGRAAVKALWDKAVAANLLASQIDLSATQVSVAAEHVVITGDTNKGQTIIEGGRLRTELIEVEKLLAQSITLRDGGSLRSANYSQGNAGWLISYDGTAEFASGTFRGELRTPFMMAAKDQYLYYDKRTSGNLMYAISAFLFPEAYDDTSYPRERSDSTTEGNYKVCRKSIVYDDIAKPESYITEPDGTEVLIRSIKYDSYSSSYMGRSVGGENNYQKIIIRVTDTNGKERSYGYRRSDYYAVNEDGYGLVTSVTVNGVTTTNMVTGLGYIRLALRAWDKALIKFYNLPTAKPVDPNIMWVDPDTRHLLLS